MSNSLRIALAAALLFAANAILTAQTGSPDAQFGIASYYADDFAGKKTSYGLTYNPNELTCAHKNHPQGTMLKVTRLDNNKTVTVRVTDRGPYVGGRIIELSRAAAERLDMIQMGVAEVKVEVASAAKKTEAKPPVETARRPTTTTPSEFSNTPPARTPDQPARTTAEPPAAKKPATTAAKTATPSATATDSKSAQARLVGKEYQQYGLYKISLEKPAGKGFAVQVASLENYENVFKQVADLQAKWFENILVSIEKGKDKPVYKIMLGPFDTEAAATNYQKNLQSKHKIKGFVVNLSPTSP